ncbi:FadR/GntR family transcriptional regulator [Mobilicoccus caccae]|uniref:FadR/GntR family transcriptional regulator n=1 Tax=Mobilicoccus caccae TaxID=1859295 RepID=UPI0024E156D9|nr:FadR/GntR family transcriptional regulator [Mobilicoccus caccae]
MTNRLEFVSWVRIWPADKEDLVARERLVQQTVDHLLERIVGGELDIEAPLPAQSVLATELHVSRLTVREAVETLRSRGIVDVRHGSGTYVMPPTEWTDADAISAFVGREGAGDQVSLQVIEVRRMIEVGAAETCAYRRTEADLVELDRLVEVMRETHERDDLDGFVVADMAFHGVILRGCRNPFLAVVYEPLIRVLRKTRAQTSAVPVIREHAIAHHTAIAAAVRAGDGPGAREAMRAHMSQTSDDLRIHVLDRS